MLRVTGVTGPRSCLDIPCFVTPYISHQVRNMSHTCSLLSTSAKATTTVYLGDPENLPAGLPGILLCPFQPILSPAAHERFEMKCGHITSLPNACLLMTSSCSQAKFLPRSPWDTQPRGSLHKFPPISIPFHGPLWPFNTVPEPPHTVLSTRNALVPSLPWSGLPRPFL